jgi:hypothetical protein
MSQIPPLTASILQAPAAQRMQETEKTHQLREANDRRKNVAARNDEEVDESVVSPDELKAAGDEQKKGNQKKNTYSKRKPPDPEPESGEETLDLRA